MGGGHLLPAQALELGIECLEQLFCHHCSKHIPACAHLAKDSIFMALLLADNQAKAVKQELRERNFILLLQCGRCMMRAGGSRLSVKDHSSSKLTEA